ncbi:MAG: hypothetical protein IIA87_01400 [Nanoarchaeota archaeon]|nr:hypothetical protein [Nanoarchaeota archaeon]
MKKRDYLILIIITIGIVAIGAFLIGVFFFSGNSESNGSFQISGSKECKWENYKQGLFASSSWTYQAELSQSAFLVPLDLVYSEVEFTGFGVVATVTNSSNHLLLNRIDCGILTRDKFALNDFTDTCLDALNEGMNFFNTTSRRAVIIHEIFVEMRYKPANCLS